VLRGDGTPAPGRRHTSADLAGWRRENLGDGILTESIRLQRGWRTPAIQGAAEPELLWGLDERCRRRRAGSGDRPAVGGIASWRKWAVRIRLCAARTVSRLRSGLGRHWPIGVRMAATIQPMCAVDRRPAGRALAAR